MDQTKFINAYIANLAEKLKGVTLDTIILTTQLTLANETIAELNAEIERLNAKIVPEKSEEAEVLPLSDYK